MDERTLFKQQHSRIFFIQKKKKVSSGLCLAFHKDKSLQADIVSLTSTYVYTLVYNMPILSLIIHKHLEISANLSLHDSPKEYACQTVDYCKCWH